MKHISVGPYNIILILIIWCSYYQSAYACAYIEKASQDNISSLVIMTNQSWLRTNATRALTTTVVALVVVVCVNKIISTFFEHLYTFMQQCNINNMNEEQFANFVLQHFLSKCLHDVGEDDDLNLSADRKALINKCNDIYESIKMLNDYDINGLKNKYNKLQEDSLNYNNKYDHAMKIAKDKKLEIEGRKLKIQKDIAFIKSKMTELEDDCEDDLKKLEGIYNTECERLRQIECHLLDILDLEYKGFISQSNYKRHLEEYEDKIQSYTNKLKQKSVELCKFVDSIVTLSLPFPKGDNIQDITVPYNKAHCIYSKMIEFLRLKFPNLIFDENYSGVYETLLTVTNNVEQ